MPKSLTIGYGDERGYEATDVKVRDQAHSHDAWLVGRGAMIGIAGDAVHVRNTDGMRVESEVGPFLRSDLPVAGFALIDAANIEEAINLVATTPCAVARGVVEIWPLRNEQA